MDHDIPADLQAYLAELDEFIENEIIPLEQKDDNIRFFDHRREDARTDWERGGLPNDEWEALLETAKLKLMSRVISDMRYRLNTAVRTAIILVWRSFVSTLRREGLVCITIYKTSILLLATVLDCC